MSNSQPARTWPLFLNVLGLLCIVGGVSLIIFRNFLGVYSIGFIASVFSQDNSLNMGVDVFSLALAGLGVVIFILGSLILIRQKRPFCYIGDFINNYFLNSDVRDFFFPSNCFLSQSYYQFIFSISLIITYLLLFLFRFHFSPLIEPLFLEDGVFEWMTVVNLFISCILLITSLFLLFRKGSLRVNKPLTILVILGVCVFCLFFMLEEISYGQRLFGWETKGVFELNDQHETNFHNFLNPLMDDLSNLFGTLLFFFLLFGWIRHRESQTLTFRTLFPHPSLFFIVATVFGITATGQSDVMEEIISILMLVYSLTLLLLFRKRYSN